MALDAPVMLAQLGVEFWRAQLRSVFPLLEDDRLRVIELAERRRKAPFLERIGERSKWNDVEHYSEAEIGQLYFHRRTFLEAEEFLKWLRETRNALAHRRPVSIHDLEQGERLRQRLFGTTGSFG
jgi:hypothetical protein